MSIKAFNPRKLLKAVTTGSPVRRAVIAVNILLVLVSLLLLVSITLQYLEETESVEPIPRTKSTVSSPRWNWFSGNQSVEQLPLEEVAELENASLAAKLLGVMISDGLSSATVAVSGKPEMVFHVGDKLEADVSLEKIEPYRIIVLESGVMKQILMVKSDTVIKTEQSSSAKSGQTAEGGFAMANMFGAVPVRVDEYGSGFKLNKLSAEMKMLADLENDDIVVDVGGTGVQELMSDPQQWIKYSAQSSLPVTVIRDGEPVVVYVNAASLSAKMLPKFK